MARGLAKLPTLKTRTQQTTVGSFKPRSSGIQTPYYAMSPEQQAQKNYEQTAQAVQSYGEDVNKAQDDRNIFEKALNLRQNQGFFGDVFEVLGRPGEVVKGAAMNANPFEGAWKGLTGQAHYSGEQVAEQLGIANKNSPRWWRSLSGFGMDLATDPLSYTNAPFEWAGKGIKGMAKKGYAMAASELSKTVKGAKLVNTLESAVDRMSSVSKSAFGLWKNSDYKNFKTNILNKSNARATATEQVAHVLKGVNDEVETFTKKMMANPSEHEAEFKALNLAPNASEEEVRKAIHEDLFNAMEANRNKNLSKLQVYEKLGTAADENGAGRFLIAAEGKDAEEQANAIMREIRNDYEKANGRMLGDNELSYTNGFVNTSPEVASFLRREVAGINRVNERYSLFGIEGALEGTIQSLAQSGHATIDITSPEGRMLFDKVSRLTNGKGVVVYGAHTGQVALSPAEVRQLMQDGDIVKALSDSRSFGSNINKYMALNQRKAVLQQRIEAINRAKSVELEKTTAEVQKTVDEEIKLQQQLDDVNNSIMDLEHEAKLNKIAIGKINGQDIKLNDGKLLVEKTQELVNRVLEAAPGIRKYLSEKEIQNLIDKVSFNENMAPGALGTHERNEFTGKGVIELNAGFIGENIVGHSLEGTLIHEIIHSMDSAIGIKLIKEGKNELGANVGAKTFITTTPFGAHGVDNAWTQLSSSYAQTHIQYHFMNNMLKNSDAWYKERLIFAREQILHDSEVKLEQSFYSKVDDKLYKLGFDEGYGNSQSFMNNIANLESNLNDPKVKEIYDMVMDVWQNDNYEEYAEALGLNIDEKHYEMLNDLSSLNIRPDNDSFGKVTKADSTAEHEYQDYQLESSDYGGLEADQVLDSEEDFQRVHSYFKKQIDDMIAQRISNADKEFAAAFANPNKKIDNGQLFPELTNTKLVKNEKREITRVNAEYDILQYIADSIGTEVSTLTSGPAGEWLSEMISKGMTKVPGRDEIVSRYKDFIHSYMNENLKLDFSMSRTIEAELANAQKQVTSHLDEIKKINEAQQKAHMEYIRKVEQMDKQIYALEGGSIKMEEAQKELLDKIDAQRKTIEDVAKKTDMNITAGSTNRKVLDETIKPATNKVQFELPTGAQKEIQDLHAALTRYKAYNDESFYKVIMKDPVLVGVSTDFERILNTLEGAKQQIYGLIERTYAEAGTNLGNVLENLNIDGYMRHVINHDSAVYLEIERLKKAGRFNASNARGLVSQLGGNARFFDQKWLGSATDINKRLGIELFNTNPIESLAVLLKLLPEHFEVTNLFQSAFESGLIKELSKEEADTIINAVQVNMNQGMRPLEARRKAFEAFLPSEYTLVDESIVRQIHTAFDFLEKGGANTAEVAALKEQIARISESKGMIMHKGVINQIKLYGKQMGNQDLRVILDNVKKYFVHPFKSLATLSAGFHVRNTLSNLTNAYLAGMKPGEYMYHFTNATRDVTRIENQLLPKLQKMMTSGDESIRTVAGQMKWIETHFKPEEKALLNKMTEWQEKGVLGVNRYSNDLSEIIRGITQQKGSKIVEGFKKTTQASMKIGKLSDDASKIAAYEWAKNTKNGAKALAQHGFEQPEQFSKFVFFDYSDLTDFEQKYMKAIFPFYTWARKNLEFQIKNMFRNTHRYVRLHKAITHWQSYMAGDEKDNLSQWDIEQMMIPVSNKNGKMTMLKVSPAFLDISETAQHPLNKLSPLLKAPLEAFAGVNFFSGRSIDQGPLGEFGQSIFGDFGEIGKAFRGQQYDKTKLGLIGSKAVAGKTAVESLVQGQATPSTLLPSIFREEDTAQNRTFNINERTRRMRSYIQGLQRAGRVPTQATPGMRPRSRQQLFEMQQRNK